MAGAAITELIVRKLMIRLGNILIFLSLPFFLETCFEAYLLTILSGPQMIGFALAHSVGMTGLLLFFASEICFVLLAIYSLIALLRFLFSANSGAHERKFSWICGICLLHLSLVLSYEYWSPIFSRSS
jgi:hypothetical protein